MDPRQADLLSACDPRELGSKVKALRVARGLTQAELAGSEISVGYVSRMESGQRRPTAKVLSMLAARLEAPLEQLLGGVAPSEVDELRLMLDYAELSLESGEAAEAEKRAREALSRILDASSLVDLSRRARLILARAQESLGRLDDAILGYEDLLGSGGAGLVQVRAALALSRAYRDSGDLQRSIKVGERVLTDLTSGPLSGSDEAVQLAVTVASAHFELGDEGHAVRLCRRAIAKAEATGSPVARASAYWNASVMQADRGHVGDALGLAQEALALLGEGKDARHLAVLRGELGRMQLSLDPPDAEGARVNLEEARSSLGFSSGSPRDLAMVEFNLARASLLIGDVVTARALLAEITTADLDAPVAAVEALVLEGQLAMAEGDPDAAAAAYRRAVQVLSGLGSDREAAQLWFDLADLFEGVGRPDAARDAYRRAAASTGLRSRSRTPVSGLTQIVSAQIG